MIKIKREAEKSATLEAKLEFLHRTKAGEKIVPICNEIGLAKSTIQTVRDGNKEIKTH